MNKQILIIFLISLFICCLLFFLGLIYINSKEKLVNTKNLNNSNDFIYEIDDVLTDEECDLLINKAKQNLYESKVMSVDNNGNYLDKKDKVRTSYQAWLDKEKYPNIVNKIVKYVNDRIKNKISHNYLEDIQVARYKPYQEYKRHYDICHPYQCYKEHKKTCKAEYNKFKSVRYITVIFYLNDGFKGGETEFPRINKRIIPKKGKMLIFLNCKYNKNTPTSGLCNIISDSEHAGLPVYKGDQTDEKWIANIWIRAKTIK